MNNAEQRYYGLGKGQFIAVGILSISLGILGLKNLLNFPKRITKQERARIYDIATNIASTNAVPGLLLKGKYQQARKMHEDMLEKINENLRDTTSPSIFTAKELSDFKARFGKWESFATNYVNRESEELERLANERVYNLSKPKE